MGVQEVIERLLGYPKQKPYMDGDPGTGFDYSQPGPGRRPTYGVPPSPLGGGHSIESIQDYAQGRPQGPRYMPQQDPALASATPPAKPPLPALLAGGPRYNPSGDEGKVTEIQDESFVRPRPPIPLKTEADAPATAEAAQLKGPTRVYGDKGQPIRAEGGETQLEDQEAYQRMLQGYKPEDHNGRFKSVLLGALRGYGAGGVSGAAAGAVQHGIDPSSDETYHNEREKGRVGKVIKGERDRQKEELDLKYKEAQVKKAQEPPQPHYMDSEDGPLAVRDNQARPIYDPEGKRVKGKPTNPRARRQQTVDGVTYEQGDDGKWKPQTEQGLPAAARVNVAGYGPMTPGQAYSADSQKQGQQYREKRDKVSDDRHNKERQEDNTLRRSEKFQAKVKDASESLSDLIKEKKRAENVDAKASAIREKLKTETDPKKRERLEDQLGIWEYQLDLALQDGAKAATKLNTAHGDIFEAGIGDRDFPYYKARDFSVSQWKAKTPGWTKAELAEVKKAAALLQMKVVD